MITLGGFDYYMTASATCIAAPEPCRCGICQEEKTLFINRNGMTRCFACDVELLLAQQRKVQGAHA